MTAMIVHYDARGNSVPFCGTEGLAPETSRNDRRVTCRKCRNRMRKIPRCADCGEWGERVGHMECQYPKDRN